MILRAIAAGASLGLLVLFGSLGIDLAFDVVHSFTTLFIPG